MTPRTGINWPPEQATPIAEALTLGPLAGGAPLVDLPIAVLVGLTGAGKTTLAKRLVSDDGREALPNRRALTDLAILPRVADQGPLDRAARFAATARFRAAAPGGMGEVLAALSFTEAPARPVLFDGLRGAAEIRAFADAAPLARFVALHVSDPVRALRIAGRRDRFDGGASGDLKRAEAVVREEARHYSAVETYAALAAAAPGRCIVIDSEIQGPEEVFDAAAAFLRRASP